MDDFDTYTPQAGASVDTQAAVEQPEPDVLEYDRYVVAFSGGKLLAQQFKSKEIQVFPFQINSLRNIFFDFINMPF